MFILFFLIKGEKNIFDYQNGEQKTNFNQKIVPKN